MTFLLEEIVLQTANVHQGFAEVQLMPMPTLFTPLIFQERVYVLARSIVMTAMLLYSPVKQPIFKRVSAVLLLTSIMIAMEQMTDGQR